MICVVLLTVVQHNDHGLKKSAQQSKIKMASLTFCDSVAKKKNLEILLLEKKLTCETSENSPSRFV